MYATRKGVPAHAQPPYNEVGGEALDDRARVRPDSRVLDGAGHGGQELQPEAFTLAVVPHGSGFESG